jgi:hypothetical protein
VIRSASDLRPGDRMRTRLADGELASIVSTDGDGSDGAVEHQERFDDEGKQ